MDLISEESEEQSEDHSNTEHSGYNNVIGIGGNTLPELLL